MQHYDDIINLERPPSNHPKMSRHDRAAQFAPFAALVGYDDEIAEAGRLTGKRIALTDEQKDALDRKLQQLILEVETKGSQNIAVTYFIPDATKEGGSYSTISGKVRKIDLVRQIMLFEDRQIIDLRDIIWIEI